MGASLVAGGGVSDCDGREGRCRCRGCSGGGVTLDRQGLDLGLAGSAGGAVVAAVLAVPKLSPDGEASAQLQEDEEDGRIISCLCWSFITVRSCALSLRNRFGGRGQETSQRAGYIERRARVEAEGGWRAACICTFRLVTADPQKDIPGHTHKRGGQKRLAAENTHAVRDCVRHTYELAITKKKIML